MRHFLNLGGAALVFGLGSGVGLAGDVPSDDDQLQMLGTYCTPCHNTQHAKAGVILDTVAGARTAAKKAAAILDKQKMPPASAQRQPADDERQQMTDWFKAQSPAP